MRRGSGQPTESIDLANGAHNASVAVRQVSCQLAAAVVGKGLAPTLALGHRWLTCFRLQRFLDDYRQTTSAM